MGVDLYEGLDLNLDKIRHTRRAWAMGITLLVTLCHPEVAVINAAANAAFMLAVTS